MKYKKISVAASFLLVGCAHQFAKEQARDVAQAPVVQSASAWRYDLLHTTPECSQPGKRSTFCTMDDRAQTAEKSGMEKRVRELLERAQDPTKAKIVIAYFSFSNKAVFDKLCEKGKSGFLVEGFFDNSYNVEESFPTRLRSECQASATSKNVVVHFLGEKTDVGGPNMVWRLHHNKFLIVDPGDGPVSVNFSSGNLSSFGLSVHFDHWAVLEAPRDSNLVQHQFCVVEALQAALVNPKDPTQDSLIDNPEVYRKSLDQCLVQRAKYADPYDALKNESIAPLFAPDPQNRIARLLMNEISNVKSGGKISGAIQHFLHRGIADKLRQAVTRGVKVQMIMDDDVILGDSEVPNVRKFYDENLKPSVSGLDLRFMQTNSTDHQLMHNKFLIMEQPDGHRRVFSGAGHFTNSGMKNNYENFYLTQNDGLSQKYTELFSYMWPNGLKEEEVKK